MYSNLQIGLAVYSAIGTKTPPATAPRGELNIEMLLGFFAMVFTLLCYIERRRSAKVRFALGVGLLLMAVFGLTERAWPLAGLQVVWAGVAFARWWKAVGRARSGQAEKHAPTWHRHTEYFRSEYSSN